DAEAADAGGFVARLPGARQRRQADYRPGRLHVPPRLGQQPRQGAAGGAVARRDRNPRRPGTNRPVVSPAGLALGAHPSNRAPAQSALRGGFLAQGFRGPLKAGLGPLPKRPFGGPALRLLRAVCRGPSGDGSISTLSPSSPLPSAVRFKALANLPAMARGIWKWVSLAPIRIAPISLRVMCPRRHSSGRIQRGSAL